ncbi:hypothetical protein [Fulvivirga ligni]|uniref:hypothetical protein n=1 Tax=Fulvivirga ligni TaxID=2904246 RepID=UPI001F301A8D|nr:hypothetical protein [Fulvivirga ligni]UII21040.1 hypothetical protein LVD16_24660 [Fulvivirga ligni]
MNRHIAVRIFALLISLQILNISVNVSDNIVGKSTLSVAYFNEIESVVELVAEVILDDKDAIPETQLPGGALGFEEEEEKVQFYDESSFLTKAPVLYEDGILYKKGDYEESLSIENHIFEVTTPPPEA